MFCIKITINGNEWLVVEHFSEIGWYVKLPFVGEKWFER